MPHTRESIRVSRGLRIQAAVFGILFTLSGAEGQQDTQLIFLGLAAGSLLLAEQWPALAVSGRRWLARHPAWQRAIDRCGLALWKTVGA